MLFHLLLLGVPVHAFRLREAPLVQGIDLDAPCVNAHSPQCCHIDCAHPPVTCPAPLEPTYLSETSCCPVCHAPDHVVPLDRHMAMKQPNPYAAPMSPTAPASCGHNVKCFKLLCMKGQKPGHVPGSCCPVCK